MCTAAAFRSKDFYFGRTLDYEFSYGDQVVILPRSYPLHYLEQETQTRHYAMIGMACVMEDTPLFYDAVNEKGLAIAGLNFLGMFRFSFSWIGTKPRTLHPPKSWISC